MARDCSRVKAVTRLRRSVSAERWAEAVERQRRAAEATTGEAPDRAVESDRRGLGVDVDDRRSLPVEVARSRTVVDADEIADDEIGERVD